MTLAPSETTTAEITLVEPDHRGGRLARALGARRVKRGGVRYFLIPQKADQWRRLYDGGWHAVRRQGAWVFTQTLVPLPLYKALERAGGVVS